MESEQQHQRDDEDQPSLELVKEALRLVGIPELADEACAENSEDIGKHGDRYGRACEQDSNPVTILGEIAVDDGEGDERNQRADTTAGFGDFERDGWKLDHISIAERGNADRLQRPGGELRGQYLKRKREMLQDDGGERDHQKQECPGKQHGTKQRPAPEQNDEARQQDDERRARGE